MKTQMNFLQAVQDCRKEKGKRKILSYISNLKSTLTFLNKAYPLIQATSSEKPLEIKQHWIGNIILNIRQQKCQRLNTR